jgi:hypothetical protein
MGRPRNHITPIPPPPEDTLRRLEDELDMARQTIIGLTRQPELVGQLRRYFSCKTVEEVNEWEERTAESIIEFANRTETPAGRNWDGRLRVLCPLCGEGPQSPYDKGFLLDEGLRRHLLGTYNSQRCEVFGTAHKLARNNVRRNKN